ncbi:MAG: aromatic ring-hydroxylating dioxygenase subunit alpha [Pseudolabrys sp.]|jgi:vanillate O-demethylase monooxygenase subunit
MDEFALNAWYPAAWARDISRSLTQRRILGRLLVLYRKEAGGIAALDDACPHRLAPLSMGRLKGDSVECGYHGMTFDCGGACTRIPGQALIPANARVRSYPIVENMGLAWIWMGDPALADPAKIPDVPQYRDATWSAVEGDALAIDCHYLNLADNLCDPAHVSFVHLSTLGNASSEDIPVHSEKQGDKIVTWRWIVDSPAIPLFKKFGNFTGNVDRWHYYYYTPPSTAIIDFGSAPTGTGAPDGNRENSLQIFACHFITPVDTERCIDHWLFIKNFDTDAATTQSMIDQFRLAFDEDKIILEAIHLNEKEPRQSRPLRIAIDASPVRMRRAVEQTIKNETATRTGGASAA